MKYDFADIERRWQGYWAQNKTFRTPNPGQPGFDPSKPKFYVLDMFPYPSGVGLHVGHPLGYIATDIVARYRRMLGFNVLHPMGYDAFGLPAEQFAVEHGVHPRITTERNIDTMTRQLKRLGLSYDWDRCLATTDPGYYRWTQWIFLQLYHSWFDPSARQARPLAELVRRLESGQIYLGPDLGLVDAGVEEGLTALAGEPVGCRKWWELSRAEQNQVLDGQRLAYLAQVPVNWCPALGTVLANEEVTADGRSERGNHPVVKRPLEQWMLRITAYGDRLLEDLDLVDWPQSIKTMQRNWIGRSEGAEVDFSVVGSDQLITVFTTRPDTLFGATYLVLAPEHPLVEQLTTPQQARAVAHYRREALGKAEVDRQSESREKTGVFTGAYAVNPVNMQEIPIWIADYVLMGYGTGAIMAVPAHDARDFDFAQQFALPIRDVVYTPLLAALSAFCHRLDLHTWQKMGQESANQLMVDFLGLCINQSRSDYDEVWRIITTRRIPRQPDGLEISARGTIASIWKDAIASLLEPGMETLVSAARRGTLIQQYGNAVSEPGVNVNSSNAEISLDGLHTEEAKRRVTDWLHEKMLGRGIVRYKLRDWLFSRQRYWGEPFPIVHTDDGQVVALDETQLSVELPEMEDFKPAAGGDPNAAPQPPLGRAPKSWLRVQVDGRWATRELNTMPQWAGSCWYYLRFCDPLNGERFVADQTQRYWMGSSDAPKHPDQAPAGGVDLYIGGAEHAVLHLLYARFWHKVLYDLGHVSTPEPFGRLFNQGYIQAHAYRDQRGLYVPADQVEEKDGRFFYHGQEVAQEFGKMGKSLKNAIAPDDVCEQYGCDTLRLYEMYLGPLDQSKVWRTRDIVGVHRFLQRVWRNFVDESGRLLVSDEAPTVELRRRLHKAIKKVTEDLNRLNFNTAIAALIELNNEMVQLPQIPREVAEPFVLLLSPMAPHIAEELWNKLGRGQTLAYEPWPAYDTDLLIDESIEYPVQINGKLRGRVNVPCNADQSAVRTQVLSDEKILDFIGERAVRKVIVVKDRLVNIVLES